MSPRTTTRWCPTAEQVMMLEEMHRGGMKIPNATQIQQITAQLANYGKIEGKNVFYWFQNHKARDKHRLRRKHHFHKHRHFPHHHHFLHYLASSSPPPPPLPATFAALQLATLYSIAPTSLPLPLPPQESRVHVENAHLSSGMNRQEGNPNHDDASERKVKVKTEMRRSEEEQEDWMMTMANNRPLVTLQLFPLTATNLKECK